MGRCALPAALLEYTRETMKGNEKECSIRSSFGMRRSLSPESLLTNCLHSFSSVNINSVLSKSRWSENFRWYLFWPYLVEILPCCVLQPVDWSGRRPHWVHRRGFWEWNTISWRGLEACCRSLYRRGKCATHARVQTCTDVLMLSKTWTVKNVIDKRTKGLLICSSVI